MELKLVTEIATELHQQLHQTSLHNQLEVPQGQNPRIQTRPTTPQVPNQLTRLSAHS